MKNSLPPINIVETLAHVAALIPQLVWRPSTNFAYDGTEPLQRRLRRLQSSWKTSNAAAPQKTVEEVQRLALACMPQVPASIAVDLLFLGSELAIQNLLVFDPPEYDLNRSLTQEEAEYILNEMADLQLRLDNDKRIHRLFFDNLIQVYAGLIASLPHIPEGEAASLTVPLHAFANQIPLQLFYALFRLAPQTPDHISQLTFDRTMKILYRNVIDVSEITPDQADANPHRLKWPDADTPTEDIIKHYLCGTPFQEFVQSPLPFAIPHKTYASHGIILAPPNHGKTQLLGAICHGFLQEADPPGLFVLDPHGDLLRKIERLDVFHPVHGRLGDRLIILDPEDPAGPPSLNFLDTGSQQLDAGTFETFTYLMSSLSSELTTKQGTAVAYILMLLRAIPGSTIDTLRQIMEDKAKTIDRSKYASVIRSLDPLVQDFFENQFYSQQMSETRQQINRRLYTVLANDTFRRMFSASRNSFDAFEAMQQKKVVLINGARNVLRAEGSGVFLRFMVAQFLSAAFRRASIPEHQRHLCVLMVDEAHHIFDDQTEAILTECRKFGLGFLAATQLVEQMEQSVKAAVYGATAIKIAGPVSYADAQALGREMYCSGDFIRSMKAIERKHADFAVFVRGMTDQAIRLTVPYGTLENAPQMDDVAHERLREINRGKVIAPVAASPAPEPDPEQPITPKKW